MVKHETYKGWTIKYWPVGGQHWRAEEYGVGMCANSVEALKRMIDNKVRERQEECRNRENGHD